MLADQFLAAAAAAGARNSTALAETSRLLWRAHAEGHIADADADAVSKALQARRAAFATKEAMSQPRLALGLPRPAKRPRYETLHPLARHLLRPSGGRPR